MDNATAESRPQPVATTGPCTIGQTFVGLHATPTGTNPANSAVADFTGATTTRRASQGTPTASAVGSTPWLHTPSDALGSTFQPAAGTRGEWKVKAGVAVASGAAAVAVRAALLVDGAPADIDAATMPSVPNGDTVADLKAVAFAAGAGSVQWIPLETIVAVREGDRPVVRLLINDDAGGAVPAAELVLTDTFIDFTFIRDVP